jgi:hypothetical protein
MYIRDRGLYLETDDIGERRLRRQDSGASLEKAEVRELRRQFYRDKARHLEPIHGAADSLLSLAEVAGVVLLSNLPLEAAELRRDNLESHGLTFPLITNRGPKGPLVRALHWRTGLPTIFIDNRAICMVSAYACAPKVRLIHFLYHERKRHVPPLPFVSLTTGVWKVAQEYIAAIIGGRDGSVRQTQSEHGPPLP